MATAPNSLRTSEAQPNQSHENAPQQSRDEQENDPVLVRKQAEEMQMAVQAAQAAPEDTLTQMAQGGDQESEDTTPREKEPQYDPNHLLPQGDGIPEEQIDHDPNNLLGEREYKTAEELSQDLGDKYPPSMIEELVNSGEIEEGDEGYRVSENSKFRDLGEVLSKKLESMTEEQKLSMESELEALDNQIKLALKRPEIAGDKDLIEKVSGGSRTLFRFAMLGVAIYFSRGSMMTLAPSMAFAAKDLATVISKRAAQFPERMKREEGKEAIKSIQEYYQVEIQNYIEELDDYEGGEENFIQDLMAGLQNANQGLSDKIGTLLFQLDKG